MPATFRDTPPVSILTSHQVWLCNPQGYRVQLVSDYVALKYNRAIKGGGGITLDLPPRFDLRYVKEYGFLEVWRKVGEQPPRYEETFVIQSVPQAQAKRGTQFLTLEGPTVTDYLLGKNSRVVAAVGTGSGGVYTDQADDLLRQLVKGALAAGAGNSGAAEGRDLSVYAGFTVEPDRNMGPTLTETAYLLPLDDALTDIAKKSEENTTSPLRLFRYVRAKSFNPLTFEFVVLARTYGKYRGFTATTPVILSPTFSNVSQIEVDHDYREAWNAVFISYGNKALSTRIRNTARRNIAPLAYREVYFDAANAGTEAEAQLEAQGKLGEGEERKLARVTIAPNAVHRYGAEYMLGDVVGTLFLGRRVEMEIASEEVVRDQSGEKVNLKLDEF